jgi:hypothetical protein
MILDKEVPSHGRVIIGEEEPSCDLFIEIGTFIVTDFEEEN